MFLSVESNPATRVSAARPDCRHTGAVNAPPLTVACLCAEWCGSCRAYRPSFDHLATAFSDRCRFVWIDVEDEADTVDGIDVENFPTLLIARGGEPLFFGPLPPHVKTLQRLIDGALDGALPAAAVDINVADLAHRLAGPPVPESSA